MAPKSPYSQFRIHNLLTLLSLFFAFIGFYLTLRTHNIQWLWGLLCLSAVVDVFDGKFASLFKRTPFEKEFGTQIDSLVDAVVFGAIPACAILSMSFSPSSNLPLYLAGLLPAFAFVYTGCALVRLGFYNIQSAQAHQSFIGLPTPITILFWALSSLIPLTSSTPILHLFLFALLSVLMVSPFQIVRPKKPLLLALILIFLSLSAANFIFALQKL